jgi:hypothetical protein
MFLHSTNLKNIFSNSGKFFLSISLSIRCEFLSHTFYCKTGQDFLLFIRSETTTQLFVFLRLDSIPIIKNQLRLSKVF